MQKINSSARAKRRAFLLGSVLGLIWLTAFGGAAHAQRRRPVQRRPQICTDPTRPCPFDTQYFQAWDLPFKLPETGAIYETNPFYAVVLKTLKDESCGKFFSESERLAAQKLFPTRKVFTPHTCEPGDVFYDSGLSYDIRILAVYAGTTRADGLKMLQQVRATKLFPRAALQRMRAGFNGT